MFDELIRYCRDQKQFNQKEFTNMLKTYTHLYKRVYPTLK